MNCHRCGDMLQTNATGCPRCDGAPSHTKKLSQTDLHKTRALVQLERCENCGWMVYPNENECSACGTWVNRPWKQNGVDSKSRRRSKSAKSVPVQEGEGEEPKIIGSTPLWFKIVVVIVILFVGAVIWHYLFPNYLE